MSLTINSCPALITYSLTSWSGRTWITCTFPESEVEHHVQTALQHSGGFELLSGFMMYINRERDSTLTSWRNCFSIDYLNWPCWYSLDAIEGSRTFLKLLLVARHSDLLFWYHGTRQR